MKVALTALALMIAVSFAPSAGFAASEPSPWTSESTYADKITNKLDYGIKNLFGGWTEIITVPMEYHKEGKNVLEGIGMGIWNGAAYTIGGAVQTATFFCPKTDIPIKDGGVQF